MKNNPIKIFMIEDDPIRTKLMVHMFAKEDQIKLECADRLSKGLKRLKETRVDLILLDLNLPDSQKLNTFRRLKTEVQDVPIVILTGLDDKEVAIRAVQEGAQDYLLKDKTDKEILLRSIHYAIERHHKLKNLQEVEERFHLIGNCILDSLVIMDDNGNIVYWNPGAEKMFGYSSDEIKGKDVHKMLAPVRYYEAVDKGMKAFKQTGKGSAIGKVVEISGLHRDGSEFPVELALSSINVRNRWWAVATIRDITERKQMEVQLRHAQKMESIGQLAAGIAHEINTPIQYIGDNTRFLQDSFSDIERILVQYNRLLTASKQGKPSSELISDIEETDLEYLIGEIPKAIRQSIEGINNVSRIVLAMKEFSHPGREEKISTDINKAIQNTITVSKNEWKYAAEMVTDFDPFLPPVFCIPGEFNQAVLNLIINAKHAIEDVIGNSSNKGKITISTHQVANLAEIRIKDTGGGIPETVRGRIFDPFFTTKEVGKGTGQGLAICNSIIVNKHGGTITFDTEMGKGTTFIIRLAF